MKKSAFHCVRKQADVGAPLTDREKQTLIYVAKGFRCPEIGKLVGLSRHTIADQLKTIYRKLDVSTNAEAAVWAAKQGLV